MEPARRTTSASAAVSCLTRTAETSRKNLKIIFLFILSSRVWTCLRGLSVEELKNATESVTVPDFWIDGLGALVEPFRPVSDRVVANYTYDGENIIFKSENSASAIFAGQTSEKPMLVGWNREDPLGWIAAIFPNGTEAEQAETVLSAAFGEEITNELLELFPLEQTGDNALTLSRIFSEYIFDCGNRYMLKNQSNLWLYQMEAPAHVAFNQTGFIGCDEGACHGVELYYLFGSFDRISQVFPDIPSDSPSQEALDLSREMQRAYLQYMKTGEMSWQKFNSSSELVARYQVALK